MEEIGIGILIKLLSQVSARSFLQLIVVVVVVASLTIFYLSRSLKADKSISYHLVTRWTHTNKPLPPV